MSTGLILSGSTSLRLPEFMQGHEKDENDELMSAYVQPPRIKVMQPTKKAIFDEFDIGTAVLMPMKVELAKIETPWHFVPLLFYPEYLVLNPVEVESLPMIRERSLDVNSEIAQKARNADVRNAEKCPENEKFNIKYVESLVFLTVIAGHPAVTGLPVAMTFSGGEHRVGSQLVGKIKARGAPRYGCIFEACVPKKKRSNAKGQWHGIDVGNPTSNDMPAFVQDGEEFKQLKDMSEKLMAEYKQGLIKVDFDDEAGSEVDTAAAAAAGNAKY